jgi:lycopene cyclase domain-containing protein
VSHLLYFAILGGCLLATAVLEYALRVQVYVRWRRLLLTVVPIAAVFTAWDLYAVHDRQWTYARRWLVSARLPGGLPIEEIAFFVVVPICAIATLEAVRRCRPSWLIGDER